MTIQRRKYLATTFYMSGDVPALAQGVFMIAGPLTQVAIEQCLRALQLREGGGPRTLINLVELEETVDEAAYADECEACVAEVASRGSEPQRPTTALYDDGDGVKQPNFVCQGAQALSNLYDADACEGFTYRTWDQAAAGGWEIIGQMSGDGGRDLRVCRFCNEKLERIAEGLLANMEE